MVVLSSRAKAMIFLSRKKGIRFLGKTTEGRYREVSFLEEVFPKGIFERVGKEE